MALNKEQRGINCTQLGIFTAARDIQLDDETINHILDACDTWEMIIDACETPELKNTPLGKKMAELAVLLRGEMDKKSGAFINALHEWVRSCKQSLAENPVRDIHAAPQHQGIFHSLERSKAIPPGTWGEDTDIEKCLEDFTVVSTNISASGTYVLRPVGISESDSLKEYIITVLRKRIEGPIKLLVPLSYGGVHWRLGIIEINKNKVTSAQLWDSMSDSSLSSHPAYQNMKTAIQTAVEEYLISKRVSALNRFVAVTQVGCKMTAEAAGVQTNGWSCADCVIQQCLQEIGNIERGSILEAICHVQAHHPHLLRRLIVDQIVKKNPQLNLSTASLKTEAILKKNKGQYLPYDCVEHKEPIRPDDGMLVYCAFKQQLDPVGLGVIDNEDAVIRDAGEAEAKEANATDYTLQVAFRLAQQKYGLHWSELGWGECSLLRSALSKANDTGSRYDLSVAVAEIITARKLAFYRDLSNEEFTTVIHDVCDFFCTPQAININVTAKEDFVKALLSLSAQAGIDTSLTPEDVKAIAQSAADVVKAVKTNNPDTIRQGMEKFKEANYRYKTLPIWDVILGAVVGAVLGILAGFMVGLVAGPAAVGTAAAGGAGGAMLGAAVGVGGIIGLIAGTGVGFWRASDVREEDPYIREVNHTVAAAGRLISSKS